LNIYTWSITLLNPNLGKVIEPHEGIVEEFKICARLNQKDYAGLSLKNRFANNTFV